MMVVLSVRMTVVLKVVWWVGSKDFEVIELGET